MNVQFIQGVYGVDRWFATEEEETQYKNQGLWYGDINTELPEIPMSENQATRRFISICSKTSINGPGGDVGVVYPPYGEILNQSCSGFTKVTAYADGKGGSYTGTEEKSLWCGFDPTTEYPTGALIQPSFEFTNVAKTSYYPTVGGDRVGDIYKVTMKIENIHYLSANEFQGVGVARSFSPMFTNLSATSFTETFDVPMFPLFYQTGQADIRLTGYNIALIRPADPRIAPFMVEIKLKVGYKHDISKKIIV